MSTNETTKVVGDAGEARALAHLLDHGLTLMERNYRVARGPRARGGEVDLILRDRDARWCSSKCARGGARRSVAPPPCRFDVVAIDGEGQGQYIEYEAPSIPPDASPWPALGATEPSRQSSVI